MQTILGKSVQCHVRVRRSVFIATSISGCFRLRRQFRALVLEGACWNSHLIMDGPLRWSLTWDKVSLASSGRALADLPMSTKLESSQTLVLDERVCEGPELL